MALQLDAWHLQVDTKMTIKVLYRVQKGYRGLAKAIKVAIFMHAPPPAPSDQAIASFSQSFLNLFSKRKNSKGCFKELLKIRFCMHRLTKWCVGCTFKIIVHYSTVGKRGFDNPIFLQSNILAIQYFNKPLFWQSNILTIQYFDLLNSCNQAFRHANRISYP